MTQMLTSRAPVALHSVAEGEPRHQARQRTISDVQLMQAIDQAARILRPSALLANGGEGVEAVIRDLKGCVRADRNTFRGLVNEHGGELHVYLRALQGKLACTVSVSQREPEPEAPWRGRLTEEAQKLGLARRSLERFGGIDEVFREFEALRRECNPLYSRIANFGDGFAASNSRTESFTEEWHPNLTLPPLK